MALGNSFDPQAIFEGMRTRDKLRDTPDTFGTRNGVAQQSNNKNLSTGSRMSIDRIRNETLRQNPDEDQATIQWMQAFGYSPQAAEWEDRKLNGMNPWLNAGEGGDNMPSENTGDGGNMDTMTAEADSQTMEMEEA